MTDVVRDALALSVEQAVAASPISRSELYLAMKRGDLRAKKHGRRTFIMRDELLRYLSSLPDYQAAA